MTGSNLKHWYSCRTAHKSQELVGLAHFEQTRATCFTNPQTLQPLRQKRLRINLPLGLYNNNAPDET